MAKKDAYYFSHDSNAQDDPKCMVLIDQMGMEGYGIFWSLIEKLRAEKNYKLPLIVCNSFAKRWGTSKEKIETVIKNYMLFVVENECFFSLRLKDSMEFKSLTAKKNIEKRWLKQENDTIVLPPYTTVIPNDTIKGKESKGNKTKLKESKVFIPPSLFDVEGYFEEKGFSKELAKRAFEFYAVNDWKDSKENAVKNWKQKMLSVWLKEENKENRTTPEKLDRTSHNLFHAEQAYLNIKALDDYEANR